MTKKRNDRLQYLELENKKLKRQLKQLHKRNRRLEEWRVEEDIEVGYETGPRLPRCPACQGDALEMVDLGKRWLIVCDECDYKKSKAKK